jgi:hypothetical protein
VVAALLLLQYADDHSAIDGAGAGSTSHGESGSGRFFLAESGGGDDTDDVALLDLKNLHSADATLA